MSLQNELQRAAHVFRDPAQFYRNILNASGVFNLPLLILSLHVHSTATIM